MRETSMSGLCTRAFACLSTRHAFECRVSRCWNDDTGERYKATSEGEDHAGTTIHLAHTAQHTKSTTEGSRNSRHRSPGRVAVPYTVAPVLPAATRDAPSRADVRIGIAIAVRYKAYMRTRPI